MRSLLAFILVVSPAWAEYNKYAERAYACLEEDRFCMSVISNECRFQAEDFEASSEACWQRELEAWQIVLDRTYSKVLLETFSGPKSVTQALRAEQEMWTEYRSLRCSLQTFAKPQNFDGHDQSCFATMTSFRAFELFHRIGVDWTTY